MGGVAGYVRILIGSLQLAWQYIIWAPGGLQSCNAFAIATLSRFLHFFAPTDRHIYAPLKTTPAFARHGWRPAKKTPKTAGRRKRANTLHGSTPLGLTYRQHNWPGVFLRKSPAWCSRSAQAELSLQQPPSVWDGLRVLCPFNSLHTAPRSSAVAYISQNETCTAAFNKTWRYDIRLRPAKNSYTFTVKLSGPMPVLIYCGIWPISASLVTAVLGLRIVVWHWETFSS